MPKYKINRNFTQKKTTDCKSVDNDFFIYLLQLYFQRLIHCIFLLSNVFAPKIEIKIPNVKIKITPKIILTLLNFVFNNSNIFIKANIKICNNYKLKTIFYLQIQKRKVVNS